jgi:hypothetical protein
VKLQVLAPPRKRPSSSALEAPPKPVSVMLGRKAARAARMLAWLAARRFSAARRSGRRVRSSAGRPGGSGPSRPCSASGAGGAGGRRVAGELGQQGVVLGALAFEGGQLAAGVEEQGFDLAQLEVGAAAHLGPPAHDAEGFLAGHQGLLGQHDALVEFAAQQVAVGELGDEAELEGLAGFVGGEELVEGGLVEALDAAPEVDLVADQVGAGPVVAADLVAAGDRQVGRRAAAGAAAPSSTAGRPAASWMS